MDIYSILQSKPHNKHYLSRYYNFILTCRNNNVNLKDTYLEKHHICPKAKDLFPEYSSFKENSWNRIDLTAREHFLAHWILWKAYGGSQLLAFWITQHKHLKGNKETYTNLTSRGYENLKKQFLLTQGKFNGEDHPNYISTKYTFFNVVTKETFIATRLDAIKKHNLNASHLYSMIKGTRRIVDNWMLIANLKNCPPSKIEHNFFNTITNEIFHGTQHSFYTKYNLDQGNVNHVVLGKKKSIKGWIIKNELQL